MVGDAVGHIDARLLRQPAVGTAKVLVVRVSLADFVRTRDVHFGGVVKHFQSVLIRTPEFAAAKRVQAQRDMRNNITIVDYSPRIIDANIMLIGIVKVSYSRLAESVLNQFGGSDDFLVDQKGGSDIRQSAAQRMSRDVDFEVWMQMDEALKAGLDAGPKRVEGAHEISLDLSMQYFISGGYHSFEYFYYELRGGVRSAEREGDQTQIT